MVMVAVAVAVAVAVEPAVSVKNTRRRDGDIVEVVVFVVVVIPTRGPDPGELPARMAGERVREGVVGREGVLEAVGDRTLGELAAEYGLRKIPAVGVVERDGEATVGWGRVAESTGVGVVDADEVDEAATDGGGAVAVWVTG